MGEFIIEWRAWLLVLVAVIAIVVLIWIQLAKLRAWWKSYKLKRFFYFCFGFFPDNKTHSEKWKNDKIEWFFQEKLSAIQEAWKEEVSTEGLFAGSEILPQDMWAYIERFFEKLKESTAPIPKLQTGLELAQHFGYFDEERLIKLALSLGMQRETLDLAIVLGSQLKRDKSIIKSA